MDALKIPPSSEQAGEKAESVSSTPNKGNVIDAAPVVEGPLEGCGHWTGDGQSVVFHKE